MYMNSKGMPKFEKKYFTGAGFIWNYFVLNLLNYLADSIGQNTNKEQYTPGWN